MAKKNTSKTIVERLYIGLLLTIFVGVVIHAPLSVWLGTIWPEHALLIKSWKEILMGVASLVLIVALMIEKKWAIFRSPLFYAIAGFAAVNIALIPLFFTGIEATLAGILVNLRYLLYFVLVYAALVLYPRWYRAFLYAFITGALIVFVFALLQATILPHDVLKYIGYGETTIMPYLTVDQNMDYIRISSTLRGPNPLGAYAVIMLAVLLAFWLRGPRTTTKPQLWIMGVLGVGSLVALWASYSRSAALAAVIALGVVLVITVGHKISRMAWIILAVVGLVIGGSLVALRDTDFVSNVILHEDPKEGNAVNSNDGHAESLVDGTNRMLQQPLGGGIGSTGSASLLSDKPLIIENQYLFVAHEVGWPGLALYIVIFVMIMAALWKRRKNWLSLAVFASGLGLAFIGILLPVWVDETVAIIWWGLVAIALAVKGDKTVDLSVNLK